MTVNSLSAIAGHEGDEEDWEKEMRGLRNEDEVNIYLHRSLPTGWLRVFGSVLILHHSNTT